MFGMSSNSAKKPAATSRPRPRAEAQEVVSIPLSASQSEKLQRLGGAAWVRKAIDKARPGAE